MTEAVLFECELEPSASWFGLLQKLQNLHRTGEVTDEELQALANGVFVLDAKDILVRVLRTADPGELKDYIWVDLGIELVSRSVLILTQRAKSVLDGHNLLPTKCLGISLSEAEERFTEIREVEYEGLDTIKFKSRPLGAGVLRSIIGCCQSIS